MRENILRVTIMRNNSDRVAVPTRYLTREIFFRAQSGAMFSRENKNTFYRPSLPEVFVW
jgi:hypothetical protein